MLTMTWSVCCVSLFLKYTLNNIDGLVDKPPDTKVSAETKLQSDLIYVLPCHFSYTWFEDFFKSLNSQTSEILKHISRFQRPKITQKITTSSPCVKDYERV